MGQAALVVAGGAWAGEAVTTVRPAAFRGRLPVPPHSWLWPPRRGAAGQNWFDNSQSGVSWGGGTRRLPEHEG